jgi:hypothetical protein
VTFRHLETRLVDRNARAGEVVTFTWAGKPWRGRVEQALIDGSINVIADDGTPFGVERERYLVEEIV